MRSLYPALLLFFSNLVQPLFFSRATPEHCAKAGSGRTVKTVTNAATSEPGGNVKPRSQCAPAGGIRIPHYDLGAAYATMTTESQFQHEHGHGLYV